MLPYRGAILHQWNSGGIPLANPTGARPAGGIPCVGMILGRIWDDSGSILGRFCTDVGSISGSISGPFEAPGFEAPGYEAPGYSGRVARLIRLPGKEVTVRTVTSAGAWSIFCCFNHACTSTHMRSHSKNFCKSVTFSSQLRFVSVETSLAGG